MGEYSIGRVQKKDLPDLLPLMRAYCDFYRVSPTDQALLELSTALIDKPECDGTQLIAREPHGRAVGFATIFWTWSTANACRVGVMNDLFVHERARGRGLAEELVMACRSECSQHGARKLTWQTAPDNLRAQAVYERIGATREQWVDYWLEVKV
jgi:GNAT superfamily N-acetyltransferase